MNVITETLLITKTLANAGIDYAIGDGLAKAVHGESEATRNLDVVVKAAERQRIQSLMNKIDYTVNGGVASPVEDSQLWRVSRVVDDRIFTVDFFLLASGSLGFWHDRSLFELRGQRIHVLGEIGLRKMDDLKDEFRPSSTNGSSLNEELKNRSRGFSRDMSPEAISYRFDVVAEMNRACDELMKAKCLGRVEDVMKN